jgi:hypothetical protein
MEPDSSRQAEQLRDELDRRLQRAPAARQPCFNLEAAMLTAQTPFAEVLAVVGQQPVAILAYSRARPPNYLSTIEGLRRVGSDPDRTAAGETSERNFFHRTSAQAVCQSRVVHHRAAADVDSVVQIATTRCDNV